MLLSAATAENSAVLCPSIFWSGEMLRDHEGPICPETAFCQSISLALWDHVNVAEASQLLACFEAHWSHQICRINPQSKINGWNPQILMHPLTKVSDSKISEAVQFYLQLKRSQQGKTRLKSKSSSLYLNIDTSPGTQKLLSQLM